MTTKKETTIYYKGFSADWSCRDFKSGVGYATVEKISGPSSRRNEPTPILAQIVYN